VLCAACLSACARTAAPPPAPTTPRNVRVVELENGFVPVRLELPPSPAGPKPAVISLLGENETILAEGMVVVTYRLDWDLLKGLRPPPEPDAPPAPKNTVGAWLLASPTPRTVGQGYFGLIAANAQAVSTVIDYLGTVPDIDPARIAIGGTSTGGFIALEATAADARIRAAVILAACGDYHRFLHLSSLGMQGAPLDLDPGYDRRLRAWEPIRHPARLTHAALLLVSGTEDLAIPISCARETARTFASAYRRAGVPERFRFVAVEGAGHNDIGERARGESLAWLRRWLQ
jgi:Prolyl oligopeptidase family